LLWLLAARRKTLRHLQLLPLLKLRPLLLRLLTLPSRLTPLLLRLLTLPSRLTPLLRLLTPSLLKPLRPLTQSRLKPRPSNLRIISEKTGRKAGFFSPCVSIFPQLPPLALRPNSASTSLLFFDPSQNPSKRATSASNPLRATWVLTKH
jgi:hypothetical protein